MHLYDVMHRYDVSKYYAMYQNYTTYLHNMTTYLHNMPYFCDIKYRNNTAFLRTIIYPYTIIRCIENYTGQPYLLFIENIIYEIIPRIYMLSYIPLISRAVFAPQPGRVKSEKSDRERKGRRRSKEQTTLKRVVSPAFARQPGRVR